MVLVLTLIGEHRKLLFIVALMVFFLIIPVVAMVTVGYSAYRISVGRRHLGHLRYHYYRRQEIKR
jgi:hypothetical protein